LLRKGIIPADLNKCTFCQNHAEDIDHLLVTCSVSCAVWQHIADELGEQITHEGTLRSLYTAWTNRRFSNKTMRKLWISSFFATLWSLWMHRNEVIFKQKEMDMQTLCHLIKWRVTAWSQAWKEKIPYSAGRLCQNFQAIPSLFP